MAEGKFYWLKLKKDFFKRHDIKIVKSMPNGKDYILFYMQLLLESIDHEGALRFSETIPYDENMLSTITDTNIDIVRSAMKIFTQLGMIEVLDDQTIYMCEVSKMIGSETAAAGRKRAQRERDAARLAAGNDAETLRLTSNCDNVTTQSQNSHIEREKEIEKEIDIEKKSIKENPPVTLDERRRIFEEARREAAEKNKNNGGFNNGSY
ncbi:MAG: phage replisome organizer N-terminal domain-containing protein [Alphaproteobacteria bacterium]|nr:phage replisome organizer N-terminal domain-containing protein [Alphaproteobacteria bacterium]